MSLLRPFATAVAALVIASPVLADDAIVSSTSSPSATMQTTTTTTSTTTTTQATNAVNVNTASAKDLMKVKGISASKARAIVSYRKKHGNFTTIDDLAKVKGFNKMDKTTLQAIQAQMTIGN